MNKICTTIEQSKKLIELGIDVNTADLWYIPIKVNGVSGYELTLNSSLTRGIVPAWTLTALFDLFPNGSILRKSDKGKYFMFGNMFDNPIDAAFEMVVWLKENAKI